MGTIIITFILIAIIVLALSSVKNGHCFVPYDAWNCGERRSLFLSVSADSTAYTRTAAGFQFHYNQSCYDFYLRIRANIDINSLQFIN